MDLISLVSAELAYYVHHEKSARLPGLGCLELVYQTAKQDRENNQLFPPLEEVVLTQNRTGDSSFTDYIDAQYPDQNIYQEFRKAVANELDRSCEVELPGLGKFYKSDDKKLHFDNVDQDSYAAGFDLESIALKPLLIAENNTVASPDNTPGEAVKINNKAEKRFPYVRIGMISSILILSMIAFFNSNSFSTTNPIAKSVSSKINVSPKEGVSEVFVASIDPSAAVLLDKNEQKEIASRQHEMTSVDDTPELLVAEILTNTFGVKQNAERQIRLIESFGYNSRIVVKDSGLMATLLILEYSDEEDLDAQLEKIKEDFPRAKIGK